MKKRIVLKVFPRNAENFKLIRELAIKQSGLAPEKIKGFQIFKKSLDARGKRPFFHFQIDLFLSETPPIESIYKTQLKNVKNAEEVAVIGAGPAGYFAALELIKKGLKPIVIERGKDVRRRRRDLKDIQQNGIVNPHSNYCFGEGGAGTYSDGKLYTRSHKRGNILEILKILVEHGAPKDILYEAHPHIGSNKLPGIVTAIRETIEEFGGEIMFDSCVTDFNIKGDNIAAIEINGDSKIKFKNYILATGHSARDIFEILERRKLRIEAKAFALGLRVEHAQGFVDHAQYGQNPRSEDLPASSYALATQVKGKGVFSFCMCPGGLIVPAATAPGEIVVNGMSLSRRDSPFANSGVVTEISIEELEQYGYKGVFASLRFQQEVERRMFEVGDGSQKAPAQRVSDFVENKLSNKLNESSYIPGLHSANLKDLLPKFVYSRLREAFVVFGQKMKGYNTNEANVVGVESRTSSPIKIPRDKMGLNHPEVLNLFPCGEGAGYAGGILSAAMDGQNVARAVFQSIQ